MGIISNLLSTVSAVSGNFLKKKNEKKGRENVKTIISLHTVITTENKSFA